MSTPAPNTSPQRPRGRPVTRPMAERIPDTPENIARAIFSTPPKKALEWDYMRKVRTGS